MTVEGQQQMRTNGKNVIVMQKEDFVCDLK
jgi:hypothetical protein